MKVELGCGINKKEGYIGIDIINAPCVDIVYDLNKGIPLEDNSVDYLIACHSIEHLDNLMDIMEEIYRVCKHKALVCIVAPYCLTSLNMANPYHKINFNEHTPRFFTTSNFTMIDRKEYYYPTAKEWPLGESDNSCLKMDLRCLKMKLYYFDEYKNLSEDEKRMARGKYINVVNHILFQLLVVKEELRLEEFEYIAKNAEFEQPVYVDYMEAKM